MLKEGVINYALYLLLHQLAVALLCTGPYYLLSYTVSLIFEGKSTSLPLLKNILMSAIINNMHEYKELNSTAIHSRLVLMKCTTNLQVIQSKADNLSTSHTGYWNSGMNQSISYW